MQLSRFTSLPQKGYAQLSSMTLEAIFLQPPTYALRMTVGTAYPSFFIVFCPSLYFFQIYPYVAKLRVTILKYIFGTNHLPPENSLVISYYPQDQAQTPQQSNLGPYFTHLPCYFCTYYTETLRPLCSEDGESGFCLLGLKS